MTFYIDLLCESEPLISGTIAQETLTAALDVGFHLDLKRYSVVHRTTDLRPGREISPKDGHAEIEVVFSGLSRIALQSAAIRDRTLDFSTALTRYLATLGTARPGILAGYWTWLAGPEGNKRTPRLERIVLNSVAELARHSAPHNKVLLVRCPK